MAFPTTDRPSEAEAIRPAPSRPLLLVREVGGILILLAAIFLGIALVVSSEEGNLVGPAGAMLAGALRWTFGGIVCFFFPVALAATGILLFLNRRFRLSALTVAGFVLILLSVTGLLALPLADDAEYATENFLRAGAIGNFMVNWEGLRLVGIFGSIGAGFILVGMGLVGCVLMTNASIAATLQHYVDAWALRREATKANAVEEEIAPTIAPRMTESRKKEPVVAKTPARTLFPVDESDAVEEEEEAPRRGLFGFLRRDKSSARLAKPTKEELEDLDDEFLYGNRSFDEDAEAAAVALEEARIDEEYERALRSEQVAARVSGDEFSFEGLESDEEDEDSSPKSTTPLPILKGNPANDRFGGKSLGDGLAKLFPQRWEQQNGATVRRSKGDVSAALDELEIDDEEFLDDTVEGEDDPLFDENIDSRPKGVSGALREAEESIEKQRRMRELNDYRLPDIQLLEDPPQVDNRMSREEMLEISQMLKKTFADFNIAIDVVGVRQGPVVTRFELKPAPGVKVSRIVGLEHDIALAMSAASVRIVAPIPGKAAIGIEVPNKNRAGVYVKELVSCAEFWDHASPLAFALGKTIEGQPYFADLKKMPHLLIAGATGAGKSVCLNTIICSLLYRQRPDHLRLLMVDPKRVELSIYQDIPHLISPVVCDAKRAAAALAWAVEQMEERYKKLVEFNVRNIDGYNDIVLRPEKQARHRGKNMEIMPHMVVIVDELADLMVVAKNEVEESIQRLAQMSRAVGIHLILATQRPSVNVITGIIKANFPTRIAFQVSQKVDSRTILDSNGAETLLGRGDMLFAPAGAQKPIRVQGAFLSDEEVQSIADHCRQMAEPMYEVEDFEPVLSEKEQRELARMMGNPTDMDDLDLVDRAARGTNRTMGKVTAGMFVPHEGGSASAGDDDIDEALVRAAARVILEGQKGSTSLVQRRLKVGFARAGRLMDMLENMGIVGPYKGSKPRDILVDCDAALAQLDALEGQIASGAKDSRSAAAMLDQDS